MARTKDSYVITGSTVADIVRELNFTLGRIADRLDRLEGIRGTAEIDGDLETTGDVSVGGDITVKDEDGETLHSLE